MTGIGAGIGPGTHGQGTSSVRRRAMITGGIGGALALLTGCGGRPITDVNDELRARPHITQAKLGFGGGLGLADTIQGRLRFDLTGDELIRELDGAWRLVTEFVHDYDEGSPLRRVQVNVNGADGSLIGPESLLPGPERKPGRVINFTLFYERYGMT